MPRRAEDCGWSSAAFRAGRRKRGELVRRKRPFGLDLDWRGYREEAAAPREK